MIRTSVLLMFLASAAAAQAADLPAKARPGGACAAAVQQYCADVPMGQGRRLVCLDKHKAQLTPACRERLAMMQRLFKFGQEQKAKTDAYLAKHNPDAPQQSQKQEKAHPPASPTSQTTPQK
jgi:hypothetical protein